MSLLSRYFINFRKEEQISHTTLPLLALLDLSMLVTVTPFSVLKQIAAADGSLVLSLLGMRMKILLL